MNNKLFIASLLAGCAFFSFAQGDEDTEVTETSFVATSDQENDTEVTEATLVTENDQEADKEDSSSLAEAVVDETKEVFNSAVEHVEDFFSSTKDEELADNESWGYQLVLDCKGCDTDVIANYDQLISFTKVLVATINADAYGEPLVVHTGENDKDKEGYSLVQFIESRSITGHFSDKSGDAYLDVFSGKEFEPETVLLLVESNLRPENIKWQFLKRKA